jgi:hypothetical protein
MGAFLYIKILKNDKNEDKQVLHKYLQLADMDTLGNTN